MTVIEKDKLTSSKNMKTQEIIIMNYLFFVFTDETW